MEPVTFHLAPPSKVPLVLIRFVVLGWPELEEAQWDPCGHSQCELVVRVEFGDAVNSVRRGDCDEEFGGRSPFVFVWLLTVARRFGARYFPSDAAFQSALSLD